MARDFHCGFKSAVYARTVYVRRVVEREGVIKCLTVRDLISPGGCRKASVHAAAFSHFRHIEPSGGWVGYRRGEETAPCPGGSEGCRLKAAFPDRVRRPRPAWLSAEGRQALGPAWPRQAAPPMHRPAGKPLDQDWRGQASISVVGVGC